MTHVATELRLLVERCRDRDLVQQMRRAAAGAARSLTEGRRRIGRERRRALHAAAGSVDEVRTALGVAVARGSIETGDASRALGLVAELETWLGVSP